MEPHVYERMRELEGRHWWFTARREILTAEIARLPLPTPARILEVGCGAGGNLQMLARFGEVQAIEPDAASRAYAAQRCGCAVHGGLLPDALPDLGQFDLVAALDVVEHVDDDAGALAALAARTRPGGFLLTTVPAFAFLWSDHDRQHHHKRRYTRAAYRRRVEATGLTICRASYFNTLLFPPIAAVRAAKSLAGLKGGDEEAMPPAPLNRLLHGLFAAERRLLAAADLPFGVSILVVAQKGPAP